MENLTPPKRGTWESATAETGKEINPSIMGTQPMPFHRFAAIAISVVLTFMLGGAFGAVVMFASALARQTVPGQLVPGQSAAVSQPQTAEVVIVLQTATPAAALAAGAPAASAAAVEPESMPVADAKVVADGARAFARLGDMAAPVQIVIFADPQCPFCKQSALETEPQLINDYVRTGKAALVYRHYTFLGAESDTIAVAMVCAGEQSRFWEFHKQVFENQQPENAGLATQALMLTWAQTVGLDRDVFKTCLANPEMKRRVQADTEAGGTLGVRGTPTMFINGRPYPGAIPFSTLQGTIDALLAETQPHVTETAPPKQP